MKQENFEIRAKNVCDKYLTMARREREERGRGGERESEEEVNF